MKAGIVIGLCAAAGVLGACLTSQAQAGPAAGAGAGEASTILATGGSSDNKNDILWIMTKIKPARGPERMVLAMYKVEDQGKGFSLRTVRAIDADLRCVDYHAKGGSGLTVKEMMEALPKEESDPLRPPPATPPNRNP
ncbi:MAG TPA: hypothetical protein VF950_04700 [Planctomycetota bacterium]